MDRQFISSTSTTDGIFMSKYELKNGCIYQKFPPGFNMFGIPEEKETVENGKKDQTEEIDQTETKSDSENTDDESTGYTFLDPVKPNRSIMNREGILKVDKKGYLVKMIKNKNGKVAKIYMCHMCAEKTAAPAIRGFRCCFKCKNKYLK